MKKIAITLILALLFNPLLPGISYAAPEKPSQPKPPNPPAVVNTPSKPQEPDDPSLPNEPTSPDTPNTPNQPVTPTPTDPVQPASPATNATTDPTPTPTLTPTPTPTQPSPTLTPTTIPANATGLSTPNSNQTGQDVKVETGTANTKGTITNTGNVNQIDSLANNNPGSLDPNETSLSNTNNASNSTNTNTTNLNQNKVTNQTNQANLDNNLELSSTSGNNQANRNTNGEVKIDSGDANVSGTIVNSVNTNLEGVIMAEYNLKDTYEQDLVLDAALPTTTPSSTAIASNQPTDQAISSVEMTNAKNGSNSANSNAVEIQVNDVLNQINEANVNNELTLDANSGDNQALDNTGGDVSVETGDANIAANILNFLNNNLAGRIIYNIVNIFGNLVGDIIAPINSGDEAHPANTNNNSSSTTTKLANQGNGNHSSNTAQTKLNTNKVTHQTNSAAIENQLNLKAQTGDNTANQNTGGDVAIETGDVEVDLQVVNLANTNLVGQDWWLVVVNEAGKWVGKIVGGEGSSHLAGSPGTNFATSQTNSAKPGAPNLSLINANNAADSANTGQINSTHNQVINQTNQAKLNNTLTLSANTGGNRASRNTGGEVKVKTGDAKIIVNLVNFVNNNLVGGRIFFTVVNVFGSWLGNFVAAPPTEQTASAQPPANTPLPTDSVTPTPNQPTSIPQEENPQPEPAADADAKAQNQTNNNPSASGGVILPTPTPSHPITNSTESNSPDTLGYEPSPTQAPDLNNQEQKQNLPSAANPGSTGPSAPSAQFNNLLDTSALAQNWSGLIKSARQTQPTLTKENEPGLVKPALAAKRDYSGLTFQKRSPLRRVFEIGLLASIILLISLAPLAWQKLIQVLQER